LYIFSSHRIFLSEIEKDIDGISFQVYDWDKYTKDDFIGGAFIRWMKILFLSLNLFFSLAEIEEKKQMEEWLKLRPKKIRQDEDGNLVDERGKEVKKEKSLGSIRIALQYLNYKILPEERYHNLCQVGLKCTCSYLSF